MNPAPARHDQSGVDSLGSPMPAASGPVNAETGMSRPSPRPYTEGEAPVPPFDPSTPPYAPRAPYVGYPPYGTPPRRTGRTVAWIVGGVVAVALVLAVACAATVGVLLHTISTIATEPQATTQVERTFAVGGTPSIVARNVVGNISVSPGRDGTISVQVTKKARDVSTAAARRDLGEITVTFAQNGDRVSVDVSYGNGIGMTRQLWADLAITVPAATSADLRVTTGNLDLHGERGTIAVNIVTGNVTATGVTFGHGSRIDLTTGDINIDGTLTPDGSLDVGAVTGAIAVTLPPATPAHLDASTVTGNITIHGWSIPITGQFASHQASGDLAPNPTATLRLHLTTGTVTLSAR